MTLLLLDTAIPRALFRDNSPTFHCIPCTTADDKQHALLLLYRCREQPALRVFALSDHGNVDNAFLRKCSRLGRAVEFVNAIEAQENPLLAEHAHARDTLIDRTNLSPFVLNVAWRNYGDGRNRGLEDALTKRDQRLLFVSGPPGIGKTWYCVHRLNQAPLRCYTLTPNNEKVDPADLPSRMAATNSNVLLLDDGEGFAAVHSAVHLKALADSALAASPANLVVVTVNDAFDSAFYRMRTKENVIIAKPPDPESLCAFLEHALPGPTDYTRLSAAAQHSAGDVRQAIMAYEWPALVCGTATVAQESVRHGQSMLNNISALFTPPKVDGNSVQREQRRLQCADPPLLLSDSDVEARLMRRVHATKARSSIFAAEDELAVEMTSVNLVNWLGAQGMHDGNAALMQRLSYLSDIMSVADRLAGVQRVDKKTYEDDSVLKNLRVAIGCTEIAPLVWTKKFVPLTFPYTADANKPSAPSRNGEAIVSAAWRMRVSQLQHGGRLSETTSLSTTFGRNLKRARPSVDEREQLATALLLAYETNTGNVDNLAKRLLTFGMADNSQRDATANALALKFVTQRRNRNQRLLTEKELPRFGLRAIYGVELTLVDESKLRAVYEAPSNDKLMRAVDRLCSQPQWRPAWKEERISQKKVEVEKNRLRAAEKRKIKRQKVSAP